MNSKVEKFLSQQEENEIVEAIRVAEKQTSGEIRIHIEKTTALDVYERAMEVFIALEMNKTKLQNGVLIYVAVEDKTFVIYGDKGINDVVDNHFWDATKDVIQSYFKQGKFKEGLIEGVLKAGKELQANFPWDDSDTNELPNEISNG